MLTKISLSVKNRRAKTVWSMFSSMEMSVFKIFCDCSGVRFSKISSDFWKISDCTMMPRGLTRRISSKFCWIVCANDALEIVRSSLRFRVMLFWSQMFCVASVRSALSCIQRIAVSGLNCVG